VQVKQGPNIQLLPYPLVTLQLGYIRRSCPSGLTHRRNGRGACYLKPGHCGLCRCENKHGRRVTSGDTVIVCSPSHSGTHAGQGHLSPQPALCVADLTTIARSSPKPAALLQSPCCRSRLPVGKWSCGGAGDERSPLGAATARAGRRSAEGTANPHRDQALSLVQPSARSPNRRRKEQG
jgi:hypothetical protein